MRILERPDTPAQTYAAVAGIFLAALGVLSLILTGVDFDSVGSVAAQPDFLIWSVSGWTTIFWIAMGGLGLLAVPRLDTARTYALFAGIVFAGVAVWGFIDGNDVVGLITADTTNNIMHAVLAALGLIVGMLPRDTQRPGAERAGERRFGSEERAADPGETIGRGGW
jgi:hypothetical protein